MRLPATGLIVVTDRLSAFDSVLETAMPHKGAVLNGLADFWFDKTQHIIPNHVIKLAGCQRHAGEGSRSPSRWR
ncbi:MAG: phosphoribosylaminoimidazolesuccinocarboxamide synthase [Hymenobacter sp.]